MNKKLKKNPLGFYEVIEKPSQEELQEYYAKKYYQQAKGSYDHEYSDDERFFHRSKIE